MNQGDHKVQAFTCMDHFLTMAFAQLTYREFQRDIEVNLRAQAKRLYHVGLHTPVSEVARRDSNFFNLGG